MATSDIVSFRGVVLRSTPVKDNDAMVLCIGEQGFFSFYAHGGKKLVSNHASALQALSESSFVCRKSSSGSLTLKEANHIKAYVGVDDELLTMACGSLILELFTRLVQEEDSSSLYPWLMGALGSISEGKDPITATLLLFAHILQTMGFGLNVDACVSCGRKEGIVSYSYREGGFLCDDCSRELGLGMIPILQLKVLRYAYKAPLSDFGRVSLDRVVAKAIMKELGEQVEELTGLHVKSIDFLLKI